MWIVVGALAAVLAALLAIPGVFVLMRKSVQTPVREQLKTMTEDRNYWRELANEYARELREKR